MDNVMTRCFKVYRDYMADLIDYAELNRRLKVIDDEIENKQGSLNIYSGSQPASVNDVPTGTLLARFPMKGINEKEVKS